MTADDCRDELIAEFMGAYQMSSDPPRTLKEYCGRYPKCAPQFRDFAAMHSRMNAAAPAPARDRPRLAAGEMLGDFRIVRFLAEGGMGEVYEAEQTILTNRRVALKVMRHGAVSPDSRARFDRERDVLARLHQTNIVPVYSAGERDGLQYFAMQFIDGATLGSVVGFLRRSSGSAQRTPSLARLVQSVLVPSPQDLTLDATADLQPERPAPTLTPEYFRSVAESLADVAESLDAAHEAQVLHRDIKPSNLMIERSGKCWVIDFGLAGALQTADAATSEAPADALTAAGAVLGTFAYMAPEQFDGVADRRSEVWSLGATLYELLALQRPFAGPTLLDYKRQIQNDSLPTLPGIPADLAAIVRKAMAKSPADRFTSLGDLADDLRRWLRSEPTKSNPPGVGRRVALWAKRNPAWTATIAVMAVAFLAIGGFWIAMEQRQRRTAQNESRLHRRVNIVSRFQKEIASNHTIGWRDKIWEDGVALAEHEKEPELRDAMVSLLGGLDAKSTVESRISATDVAFDRTGQRLLLRGSLNPKDPSPTRVQNLATGEFRASPHRSPGPVGWRGNQPLQVLSPSFLRASFQVWNIDRETVEEEFDLPGDFQGRLDHTDGLNRFDMAHYGKNLLDRALSADGLRFAALDRQVIGRQRIVIWKSGQRKPEHFLLMPTLSPDDGIHALALSDDGSHIVIGTQSGTVYGWDLSALTPDASFKKKLGNSRVTALAFGRQRDAPHTRWRLAAGDSTGTLAVWDLSENDLLLRTQKSHHEIYALIFSPDCETLFSTGRAEVRAWGVLDKSQRLLLQSGDNWHPSLALSPQGNRLATASILVFGYRGAVRLFDLEKSRGIQELYGLTGQPARLNITPDGHSAAALSGNLQIGVWAVDSGELLTRFVAPQAQYANQCDIRLSDDGRFLYVAGREMALCWEITPGDSPTARVVHSWSLPPASVNRLAITNDGRTLLSRHEAQNKQDLPNTKPKNLPGCMRLYELLPGGKLRSIATLTDHPAIISNILAAPDGACFVVQGLKTTDKASKSIEVYSGADGRNIMGIPTPDLKDDSFVILDNTGKFLQYSLGEGRVFIRPLQSENPMDIVFPSELLAAHRDVYAVQFATPGELGLRLTEVQNTSPFLRLSPNHQVNIQPRFTPDGRKLVWGLEDGTIQVGDLDRINASLKAVGMDWKKSP